MKVQYFEATDMLAIDLSDGESESSREVSPGIVVDLDRKGNVVCIEIDSASTRADLTQFQYLIQRAPKAANPEAAA